MKINHILASLAVIGGISAAFTNYSDRNNFYPTWKYEKERKSGGKVQYISATRLADLLFSKEQGLTILDARDGDAFDEYHIPLALRYVKGDAAPDFDPKSTVVFYGSSADDGRAEISDELPKNVYVLKGGIEEWFSVILFPDFFDYHVRNNDQLEHIIRRSQYFGGEPKNTQLLNITIRESRYREGC